MSCPIECDVCDGCLIHPTCAICDEPITDTPVPVHEYGDAVGHANCVARAGEKQDVAKHG